ncbi:MULTISPECIES: chemotaxis protein CheA [unclassified Shinella]|uniref:chemotaxis protein CheA n=1 Tax=unclassified Shinella TaxID=2643062 RepID=UPI00225D5C85|nr:MULTISPECIES: chemotaxis protein CheA [unclassified Shinella]MCO5136705.1 chemotaxis protein CheA [Shinella sp.]MDC7253618.1 chemotaxis protein CheA [Shinella sp. YE25]CAI0336254.1 Signal transduction histidine kinase CheA [Rhizobiaceae bacterium]CAK7254798.1 two-component system, chemotaxis family, sensor kinase CheA [Shinella sp. WSC3-e]
MTNPDPISVFRTEAAELLEQIESGLLDLTRSLDDRDRIDAVFRGLHTLKGSGAMFGFDALAAFTHHCETAFDRVRKGDVPATHELVSAVLSAQDHMRALLETPNGDHDAMSAALLDGLHRAVNGAGSPVPAAVAAAPVAEAAGGLSEWRIRFSLPVNAMANGTNPLGLLDEMRDLGECRIVADTAKVPELSALEPRDIHISWDVTLKTERPRADIEDVFIFVMDDMELEITEVAVERPAAEAKPAETPIARAVVVAERDAPAAQAANDSKQAKSAENVRVPAERLDEMMDRVGELVIAQSRLTQLAGTAADLGLRSVSEEIERLSGELRDTMMVLRMMPVASLFSRFRRLVHDLSRETGKEIELITEGESTEVDKTVIDRLADPLVHLVRNSIDHGLEKPEERIAAGKDAKGRVILSAHQTGGEVIITIKDDGRGINRERVRAKAEASGIIQPGATLSDQDLLQLIFQPGFSTAQAVTNLSGRGVGMDVVKKTVEALRGTIDIASKPGEGSVVALRIPLTLAIIEGLLVRVGQGCYVIPLSAVEECLELSLEDDLRSRGRSFISLRDSLVPFLRLRELFRTGTPPDPYQKVVVISTGSERVGLVVDQIIGDHQTVIKSMSKLHHDVDTFSGATILGDGSVALILDVTHLVAAGQQQEAQLRAAG